MQKDYPFSNNLAHSESKNFSGNTGSSIGSTTLPATGLALTHHVQHYQFTNPLGQTVITEMSTGDNVPSINLAQSHYPQLPSQTIALNNDHCTRINGDATITLAAMLNSCKYLDDYEYYRGQRIKQNAMRRFGVIMQSIEAKYKDCPQSAVEEENDSDILDETKSEFSIFNQILRRHRKRFKQNPNLHHH